MPPAELTLTAPNGTLRGRAGTDDYTYLVGFTVQGGKVLVVEAAGEVSRLEARRSEIRAALIAETVAAQ